MSEQMRRADGSLLADTVVAHIRALIATGRLRQGERVKELEISNTLGISRGPVREAVRRLSASGLLVGAPNLGSRVIVLTEDVVHQAYAVREALEALGAELAARNMSPSERESLIAVLDEHEAVMRQSSPTSYPAGTSDWDFHLRILKGAANDFVWRMCGIELRDMMTLMRAQHSSSAKRGLRALQEHRWIAYAIAAGDADLAALLMRQHIRASRDNLLAGMASRRSGSPAGAPELAIAKG